MGSQLSIFYHTVKSTIRDYNALSKRVALSPGIPVQNDSIPFWTVPNSPIARHGEDKDLPPSVDVVIIGSGITGTAIARTILEQLPQNSDSPIKIVMLEARDACSGATGRNGGHICPNIYNEYRNLNDSYGVPGALEILRFRLAHLKALINVADEENLLNACQARTVVEYDAYMDPDFFKLAKYKLEQFLEEAPNDLHGTFEVLDDRKDIAKLQLSSSIRGCIMKQGAVIHTYRFVTGLLSNLISRYSNFQLFTRTPCTDIRTADDCYIVSTPRGEIKSLHVVHATNAWSSHLLPGMRKKIVPFRAHMSAQRPGQSLSIATNSRAFVLYPSTHNHAFDYLVQLLPRNQSDANFPTNGEMMFGGGSLLGGASESILLENVGIADDSKTQFQIEAYLAGSLERYFTGSWGAESVENDDEGSDKENWGKGRIKAVWSGIIGASADALPWVGRVPNSASRRSEPVRKSSPPTVLAAPGEWISAGFSGEGMVQAWLCGKAVARMMLGKSGMTETVRIGAESDMPLPEAFLISDKRLKKTKLEDLLN